jgi:DNA-binding MarR family transcriptional regulator
LDARLPLPALLSHALVAFTIEFDNEAEHLMPHRTTRHGSTAGDSKAPWLVSLAMWSNCMRFVTAEGVAVSELHRLARTQTNLRGMERWGYITVKPALAGRRPRPPRSQWVIRATPAGRKAQEIWRPLFGIVEKRWEARFGRGAIEALRKSLLDLVSRFEVQLPNCLPILGYGLFSHNLSRPEARRARGVGNDDGSPLPLSALLSKVLLMFALELESDSEVSLAICANVLRLVGERGTLVRDLARMAAISKEAMVVSVNFLEKRGYAAMRPESPGSRTKELVLTAKGDRARDKYRQLVWAIEDRWQARYGVNAVPNLRRQLELLVGDPTAGKSLLFSGLDPYPNGWRASLPALQGLPHYPVVSHRGGFPDGS